MKYFILILSFSLLSGNFQAEATETQSIALLAQPAVDECKEAKDKFSEANTKYVNSIHICRICKNQSNYKDLHNDDVRDEDKKLEDKCKSFRTKKICDNYEEFSGDKGKLDDLKDKVEDLEDKIKDLEEKNEDLQESMVEENKRHSEEMNSISNEMQSKKKEKDEILNEEELQLSEQLSELDRKLLIEYPSREEELRIEIKSIQVDFESEKQNIADNCHRHSQRVKAQVSEMILSRIKSSNYRGKSLNALYKTAKIPLKKRFEALQKQENEKCLSESNSQVESMKKQRDLEITRVQVHLKQALQEKALDVKKQASIKKQIEDDMPRKKQKMLLDIQKELYQKSTQETVKYQKEMSRLEAKVEDNNRKIKDLKKKRNAAKGELDLVEHMDRAFQASQSGEFKDYDSARNEAYNVLDQCCRNCDTAPTSICKKAMTFKVVDVRGDPNTDLCPEGTKGQALLNELLKVGNFAKPPRRKKAEGTR